MRNAIHISLMTNLYPERNYMDYLSCSAVYYNTLVECTRSSSFNKFKFRKRERNLLVWALAIVLHFQSPSSRRCTSVHVPSLQQQLRSKKKLIDPYCHKVCHYTTRARPALLNRSGVNMRDSMFTHRQELVVENNVILFVLVFFSSTPYRPIHAEMKLSRCW